MSPRANLNPHHGIMYKCQLLLLFHCDRVLYCAQCSFFCFFRYFLFRLSFFLAFFFFFEQLDQMRGRIVGCEDEQVRLKPTGHSSEHRQYRRHSTDADTGYPDYTQSSPLVCANRGKVLKTYHVIHVNFRCIEMLYIFSGRERTG